MIHKSYSTPNRSFLFQISTVLIRPRIKIESNLDKNAFKHASIVHWIKMGVNAKIRNNEYKAMLSKAFDYIRDTVSDIRLKLLTQKPAINQSRTMWPNDVPYIDLKSPLLQPTLAWLLFRPQYQTAGQPCQKTNSWLIMHWPPSSPRFVAACNRVSFELQ